MNTTYLYRNILIYLLVQHNRKFDMPVTMHRLKSEDFAFDLNGDAAYEQWRNAKLGAYPASLSGLRVEIDDLANISAAERAALMERCRKANMALYVCKSWCGDDEHIRKNLRSFAQNMGLHRTEGHRSAANDGIVAIEIAGDGSRQGYIPYTGRPLSWHTDGYYNAPEERIGAFLLHCVRGATNGGENGLLDPEIAYIAMRDENPDFIAAFMHDEAMTIPANDEGNGKVRPASIGPVFFTDPETGALRMRYSARGKNIIWRDTPQTHAATAFLNDLLASDDPMIFRHKLSPGEGIICNNVLHCRSGFSSDTKPDADSDRLIYRVRYLDTIALPADRTSKEENGQTE